MFSEYIEAALERAVYKTIEDEEPIFVSVPELPGAWATGRTVEEARKELISVIEGWIALRLRMGRSIPHIDGHTITASIEPVSIVEQTRAGFTGRIDQAVEEEGFEGPYPESDHDYMVCGDNFVRIPNPHRREIGVNLISEILREGEISRDEWRSDSQANSIDYDQRFANERMLQ